MRHPEPDPELPDSEGGTPDCLPAAALLLRRTDERGAWAAEIAQGAHLPLTDAERAVAGLQGGDTLQAVLWFAEIAGAALVLALVLPHVFGRLL